MNTQNTPIHLRLWNNDFWLLSIAGMLVCMSVYMLLPVLPLWLLQTENFSSKEAALSLAVFGIGLFGLGWLCSWLVQHFRRNVVCLWAIAGQTVCIALLWYIDSLRSEFVEFWVILVQRFVFGAVFGLAMMVLSSTLIIDTCESAQRTEANYCAAWFFRFSLSLGPLAGLLIAQYFGFRGVIWGAVGCSALALLLIKLVNFPFRAPDDDVHVVSLDRFLLPRGFLLFVNLFIVSTAVGFILSLPHQPHFYAAMMVGFLVSILAQRFVFRDAELKSEVVSGLILLLFAQFVLLAYPLSPVAPLLLGIAVGLVASRFLLFFIKLSRHCQRGTSQSTYFLGWESGLALGLGLGYVCFPVQRPALLYVSLSLTIAALLLYNFVVHSWFLRHKNR